MPLLHPGGIFPGLSFNAVYLPSDGSVLDRSGKVVVSACSGPSAGSTPKASRAWWSTSVSTPRLRPEQAGEPLAEAVTPPPFGMMILPLSRTDSGGCPASLSCDK
jgi:hypothetical protein